MWNLKCGTNEPTYLQNRNRRTDRESRLVGVKVVVGGVGGTGSLGLVDANFDTYSGSAVGSRCAAQGTLSSLL